MNASEVKRPNLYIEKLLFNNGESLEIGKGDIVVFVGPNNVGKSQLLKDVHNLAAGDIHPIVLNDIYCSKSPLDDVCAWFDQHLAYETTRYGRVYHGYQMGIVREAELKFIKDNQFGVLRDLVVHFLNTDSRLLISKPAEGINRDAPPKSPIHNLTSDADLLEKV